MASREGNVGLRLLIIGKNGMLTGLREVQAAVAQLNAEIRAGAGASREASAATDAQMAGLARLQAQMRLYETNLATVNAETDALARVGKVAFFTLAAAGAAWGYESIKWAQSYQTALVQLRTQAGLTVHAMNAIGRAAKANSAGLGVSMTTYVKAAYHPASAGFSTRETVQITNAALRLAAIGGSPVETTTNALTGIIKSYNIGRKGVTATAARLDAIIGSGNMHAATLNAALSSGVAATAKTFGVSLTSLGGALAFMTDRGVPASQAGTHLRMTLSLLGAPSKLAATLLKTAGMSTSAITSSTNAMSQMLQASGVTSTELSRALRTSKGKGGIYNALALLKHHMTAAGLTQQMQSAMISRSFGGGRMGSTIMMMYNTVASLGAKTSKIDRTSSMGFFETKWKRTQGTYEFQLHKFESTVKNLGTTFGEHLLPPLTKALSALTSFIDYMSKHKGVVIALGTAVSAVLVPAIGLYLYRALLSSGGAIRTVLQGYKNLISGQSAEQLALERTQAQLAATTADTEALAAADKSLAGAASTAAGRTALTEAGSLGIIPGAAGAEGAAGRLGLKGLLLGAAGKVGAGAMIASITTPMLNQYLGKDMKKVLGARGKTDAMDALTGAQMGMFLGPEGALAGAALGALYGERGHLKSDLTHAGTAVVHGLDWSRHEAAHLWDGLFGGGSASTPVRQGRLVLQNHVHVYLTGKELKQGVVKQTRREAARTS